MRQHGGGLEVNSAHFHGVAGGVVAGASCPAPRFGGRDQRSGNRRLVGGLAGLPLPVGTLGLARVGDGDGILNVRLHWVS